MSSQHTSLSGLESALRLASPYPSNNYGVEIQSHTAKALQDQLKSRSEVLFSNGADVAIHFLELPNSATGTSLNTYQKHTVRSGAQLTHHLRPAHGWRADPLQRFIFIRAKSSKSPLRITKDMMLGLLTYTQVVPGFLHFVLPFGQQHQIRDFHMSRGRLRSATRLAATRSALKIPRLQRSGRHIELCYSLKSVEQHAGAVLASIETDDGDATQRLQRWSIRQCSIHHNLQRVNADSDNLQAALAVHRIIASWSGENWHWYINELEHVLEELTGRTVYIPLETTTAGSFSRPRMPILPAQQTHQSRYRSVSLQSTSRPFRRRTSTSIRRRGTTDTMPDRSAIALDSVVTEEPEEMDDATSQMPSEKAHVAKHDFKFSDMQTIEYPEEEANKTMLVLSANAVVVHDSGQEYATLQSRGIDIIDKHCDDVEDFLQHLKTIEDDLKMEQSRIAVLLRIAADRKKMLEGILQSRSTESTILLAEKAQQSAENMEEMTQSMHAIAEQTQKETVTMRTINIVTLLFLPGTFISTLMSTPIIDFEDDKQAAGFSLRSNVGYGALKLYLTFSLPFVLFTFLLWLCLQWQANRQRKHSTQKLQNRMMENV